MKQDPWFQSFGRRYRSIESVKLCNFSSGVGMGMATGRNWSSYQWPPLFTETLFLPMEGIIICGTFLSCHSITQLAWIVRCVAEGSNIKISPYETLLGKNIASHFISQSPLSNAQSPSTPFSRSSEFDLHSPRQIIHVCQVSKAFTPYYTRMSELKNAAVSFKR